MGALAKAPEGRVAALLAASGLSPDFTWLRQPEVGTVMVQGRAGGTGAPFNFGETTVTRCALEIAGSVVGHAYVQGRRKACAQAAALVDALMQTDAAGRADAEILEPIQREMAQAKQKRAEKAAATKVDFFTLVRGEDG